MPTTVKKMNAALYHASVHLLEASKYLSDVHEFEDQAATLMLMADYLVNIIQPETPKMTMQTMESIMGEIAKFATGDAK